MCKDKFILNLLHASHSVLNFCNFSEELDIPLKKIPNDL